MPVRAGLGPRALALGLFASFLAHCIVVAMAWQGESRTTKPPKTQRIAVRWVPSAAPAPVIAPATPARVAKTERPVAPRSVRKASATVPRKPATPLAVPLATPPAVAPPTPVIGVAMNWPRLSLGATAAAPGWSRSSGVAAPMQAPPTAYAPARPVPIDATQQFLRSVEQRMSQWPGPGEQGHGRCVVLAQNEPPLDCDSTVLAAVLQPHAGMLSELQQMLRTMQGETTLTIAFSDGRYQALIAR